MSKKLSPSPADRVRTDTSKRDVPRYWLVAVMTYALLAGCQGQENLSTFEVTAPPPGMSDVEWIDLVSDAPDDGQRAGSADGRALAYHYDANSDTLWFRLELYGAVDEKPAVSISLDVDADQRTGIAWYGANSTFTFDKMLSVGPLEVEGESFFGYNGITNAHGVSRRDWINERQGVLTFFVDTVARVYILGVARTDIAPDLQRFHVIGSVGSNARWNDDIGEEGYSTIDLDRGPL